MMIKDYFKMKNKIKNNWLKYFHKYKKRKKWAEINLKIKIAIILLNL